MEGNEEPPDIDETSRTSNKDALKRAGEDLPKQYNKVFISTKDIAKVVDGETRSYSRRDYLIALNKNRYKPTDSGPFYVFVESIDLNAGNIHPMKLGKIIWNSNTRISKHIQNISVSGRNRLKIETDNYESANALCSNELFNANNLYPYISTFFTQKRGIIRNVSTDFSTDELIAGIKSPIPVVSVRRFTKKSQDENGQMKIFQLSTCLVTFDSQHLPEFINIFGMRCRVDAFIPPIRQCFNCLRYNHTKDQCRSRNRCINCGQSHPESDCEGTEPFCAHCSGKHKSNDRNCPVYKKLVEENKNKAKSNALYSTTATSNKFNLLQNLEDFPELPTSNQTINLGNPSHQKTIHRKFKSSIPPVKVTPTDSTNPSYRQDIGKETGNEQPCEPPSKKRSYDKRHITPFSREARRSTQSVSDNYVLESISSQVQKLDSVVSALRTKLPEENSPYIADVSNIAVFFKQLLTQLKCADVVPQKNPAIYD
ncbi:uncharacterized protein LOC112127826 [Cimex lectularius]|uniref:Nucleic-acid-binding protein from transposon X-element n=1 Tax=Cimex lectularius TaxID=79782 RepID=A0A8I6SP21_CIMLE|nr:uncharacterized protein LOC112127826 [Cimex lectularius]